MVDPSSNGGGQRAEHLPPDPGAVPFDDELEDNFLTESLAGLAKVTVPAGFLPNVMFRVYEKHHRDKLPLMFILAVSLALLAGCGLFFALDVRAYSAAHQLESLSDGLHGKLDLLNQLTTRFGAEAVGFTTAAWRIVAGAVGATSALTLVLMTLGLALVVYLVRKLLTAMMG